MTSIQIFDGSNTIGGNKIYIEEKGEGVFLDFGMNFKKYGVFYQEYISPRSYRGIYDLINLDLIPRLNIYRDDLIPKDLDISKFPSLNIKAIILSHAHMDHFGNIGLLRPDYPIIASPSTIMLLKAILDTSKGILGSDVVYFSHKTPKNGGNILETDKNKETGRNFISTNEYSESFSKFFIFRNKKRKNITQGKLSHLNTFSFKFEIKAFEVDHSIFGATGYILKSGDNTVAYTGDFRLHGKNQKKSEMFIQQAKDVSVLIIDGTGAAMKDVNESENNVYEKCLKTAEKAKGLIIADFTARNFERLEAFKKIATKVGRSLIITTKDAYLLNALEKADGNNRTKKILVYKESRTKQRNWERSLLKECPQIEYIDPINISKNQDKYIMCFSLYDIKNLLDIKPENGTYIYSSSEAFEEESEFDFVRLNNWLRHFEFKIHGFEVADEDGKIKPKFIKGFHASGHASKSDLIRIIDTIDPDKIIPVHTNNPEWFSKNFENIILLKDNKRFEI